MDVEIAKPFSNAYTWYSSSGGYSAVPLQRLCYLCQEAENFIFFKKSISQLVANKNTPGKLCCHVLEDFCLESWIVLIINFNLILNE